MSKKLNQLQDENAQIVTQARAIIEAADAEDRELSEEEAKKVDALTAKSSDLRAQIERERALLDAEAGLVSNAVNPRIDVGEDRKTLDAKGGFKSYAEFAMSVRSASLPGGGLDQRLVGAAPTTYGNEGAGADGAYLIPPEFSSSIRAHALEEDAILPMTDNVNVSGNSMSFPADETTPWGSDGVRAYWEAEASQATQTKPALKLRQLRLHKLFALVPMTDELLADASALEQYLTRKTGESIRWKTNDSFINGTGAGQPLGILNSAAKVEQAKETSQTADTINASNVVKMFSRQMNPGRAVWVINHDAYPQLPLMTLGDQPIYTPNFTVSPAGALLGRPIMLKDSMKTVGDAGDIAFVDWGSYQTITKASGLQPATSMHLWFDYDVTAFRVTFRVDGRCWLDSAITPPNSASTRSPIVTLAARA